MTYRVLTLYSTNGKILGWWYGQSMLVSNGHVVHLVGEDTERVTAARPKQAVTFEYHQFAVKNVQLHDFEGTEKVMRYVVVPDKLDPKFWRQKQAIKWEGDFHD